MVNIKKFIKSKRVKSMHKQIITSDPDNWIAIGKCWLTSLDDKFASDFFLCKCSDVKNIGCLKISDYYKRLLDS